MKALKSSYIDLSNKIKDIELAGNSINYSLDKDIKLVDKRTEKLSGTLLNAYRD